MWIILSNFARSFAFVSEFIKTEVMDRKKEVWVGCGRIDGIILTNYSFDMHKIMMRMM
ncbi:Uncharacterised protein [Burkholderia pseudomallei]|nr:Uncharacterised protein [Burkholderia pseudomallei]